MHIQNAKIESTHLGYEDHGIFSVKVQFTGPGWGQGTGHFNATSTNGIPIIKGIVDAVGVQTWEDLPGEVVRVRRENEFGPILAVGHIMEERWFDLPR